MAAGFPPADFWGFTPAEVLVALRAASDRMRHDAKERQLLVYMQAKLNAQGWHAPKKMPSFEKVFGGREKQQSADDMRFALQAWVAVHKAQPN